MATTDITVSGTYTGTIKSISARVVEPIAGTVITDWTVIDSTPTGGVFSGILPAPDGDGYRLEVRDDASGISAIGGNIWGIGIIVGLIGQSNIAHWLDYGTDLTANDLVRTYTSSWARAKNTTGNGKNAFANRLATDLNIPIGLVFGAVSGTALTAVADEASAGHWTDTSTGSIYDNWLTKVNAIGGKLEYIVWGQGERDAKSGLVDQATYITTLEAFFADQVRADITNGSLNVNLPIVISALGRGEEAGDTDAGYQAIRSAQLDVFNAGSDLYLVTTEDFSLRDLVHYTDAAYLVHGDRCAQAILYALGVETYYRGPKIISSTLYSSTEIDVIISHNGGTDFTPTTGITGFRVLDDGVEATISSAIRVDAATIRLTVSAPIAGVLSVDYLWGATPDVSGIVVDNSSKAIPLEYI